MPGWLGIQDDLQGEERMIENQLIGARSTILVPFAPEPETYREKEAWASLALFRQALYGLGFDVWVT